MQDAIEVTEASELAAQRRDAPHPPVAVLPSPVHERSADEAPNQTEQITSPPRKKKKKAVESK
jgi:hypothetical protein